MPHGRVVQALNILLLLAILGAAAFAWWVLYYPLPKTAGVLSAPVGSPVLVKRDKLGVPHIDARTIEDALFAQGFVTAQDRFWQMEGLRRFAKGELSEIVGKGALESDLVARRLRIRKLAEAGAHSLPPADRAALSAYVRGINHYLETNRTRIPAEFVALRYDPLPWTLSDSLAIGLLMFRNLTSTWEQDLLRRRMIEGGDAKKVFELYPVASGGEAPVGSNAWAISGARTVSGKPILANDPHLEFSLPSTWYMIHLKAQDLDVAGASLPGLPAVVIGHNQHIAWGITALQFDVQDLYVENIDLRTGVYSFRGQQRQAQPELEFISVKDEQPQRVLNWITVHGPIFTSDGPANMSLKWIAAEPGNVQLPQLQLNRARNFKEFRDATRRMAGPGINLLYADREGNIGFQVAGVLPVRKTFSGAIPVDGSSGNFEWEGYIPFDDLPHSYNPAAGILASSNQNPFPEDYPFAVGGNFDAPYRQRQVLDRLASKPKWRVDEMLRIQMDVYSAFQDFLAREAVAAAAGRKDAPAAARQGADLLKNWNGQIVADSAPAFLAQLMFRNIRRRFAEQANPKIGAEYAGLMAPAVIQRILQSRPPGWFKDYDALLVDVLAESFEEAQRQQGKQPERWKYGRTNELTLTNPVATKLPWVGPWFDIGPVQMAGNGFTVKQTTKRIGPSMRFVADFTDWDKSLMNLTLGQSGLRMSGHYKDQWPAYLRGSSLPLPFNRVEAVDTLTLRPQ